MYSRLSRCVTGFLALACVALMPLALGAQDSAKPAAKAAASDSPSRWDIFLGYSYLKPYYTVN